MKMTFTRRPATCGPWLLYIFLCSGKNLCLKGTEALLLAFFLPLLPGKTAAFALPVLERLIYKPRQAPVTRVLVLVPTRELGIQVHSVTKQLAQFCNITTCLAVGECLAEGCQPLGDSCRGGGWMCPTLWGWRVLWKPLWDCIHSKKLDGVFS